MRMVKAWWKGSVASRIVRCESDLRFDKESPAHGGRRPIATIDNELDVNLHARTETFGLHGLVLNVHRCAPFNTDPASIDA
jgi:hypothetical protein